jgi:hypothetical protein
MCSIACKRAQTTYWETVYSCMLCAGEVDTRWHRVRPSAPSLPRKGEGWRKRQDRLRRVPCLRVTSVAKPSEERFLGRSRRCQTMTPRRNWEQMLPTRCNTENVGAKAGHPTSQRATGQAGRWALGGPLNFGLSKPRAGSLRRYDGIVSCAWSLPVRPAIPSAKDSRCQSSTLCCLMHGILHSEAGRWRWYDPAESPGRISPRPSHPNVEDEVPSVSLSQRSPASALLCAALAASRCRCRPPGSTRSPRNTYPAILPKLDPGLPRYDPHATSRMPQRQWLPISSACQTGNTSP